MRHIPAGDTAGLSVLSFEQALLPSASSEPYDHSRWLYLPDHYCEYRYILGTRGKHPLICVGVNPSTAVPGNLDPTLKSAERSALGNGFDSFVMFNVYAQRATIPDDMDSLLNPTLHEENMKAFVWLLQSMTNPPVIWAAWGAVIEKRPYLPRCVQDMVRIGRNFHAVWRTAGPRSKAGHPHHPLYLKKDTLLDPFQDLDQYLCSLSSKAEKRR